VRKGPYGLYVQLGEAEEAKGKGKDAKVEKPKRVSLPRGVDPETIDLDRALRLLALPREIGEFEGAMISAGLGRFGPYLQYNGVFYSLRGSDDVLEIGHNRAVEIISKSKKKPPKVLGKKDGKPVTLRFNRWGPFVAIGKTYASLPKSIDPEAVTLETAINLLAAKGAPAKEAKEKAPKTAKRVVAEKKTAAKPKAAAKAKKAASPAKPRARKAAADSGE